MCLREAQRTKRQACFLEKIKKAKATSNAVYLLCTHNRKVSIKSQ